MATSVPAITTLAAVSAFTVNALLELSAACFPFTAALKVPVMPATVTVPFKYAATSQCSSRFAMTSRAITSVLQVTLATDRFEVELIELPALAIVVMMSVPLRYKGPASSMELPITAEPLTLRDGMVTAALNTALLAEMPSLSTLSESARLKVPDAGFMRAQVISASCNEDADVSKAFYPASASVSPVTDDIATAVDCCA